MLFKNQATILIYLTDKSLKVSSPENEFDQVFDFPKGILEYGEIINEDKLKEETGNFFQKNQIKGTAAIVLSEKLVFKETLETGEKSAEEVKKFFQYIPLKTGLTAKLIIQKENKLELFAANKSLFEIIKTVAGLNNITISSVTPVNAFAEDYSAENLSTADVQDILKDTQTLEKYDFLKTTTLDETSLLERESSENKHGNKNLNDYTIPIGIIILLITIPLILLAFGIIKNPFNKIPAEQTILPTATPIASPVPTTTPVPDKSSVKIQVLNGSGVAGQAKKTADAITALGYNNITTGNAPDSTASATTVSYKSSTPKNFIEDITSVLKKIYSSVASSEAKLADFDVVIVTGK